MQWYGKPLGTNRLKDHFLKQQTNRKVKKSAWNKFWQNLVEKMTESSEPDPSDIAMENLYPALLSCFTIITLG